MNCPTCGTQLMDGTRFCHECGATITSVAPSAPVASATPAAPSTPVTPSAPIAPSAQVAPNPVYTQQPSYQAPIQERPTPSYNGMESGMSKKTFLNLPANKNLKSNITFSAVACYILAVVALVPNLINNYVPVEIMIMVGGFVVLGLCIQVLYSRVASVLFMAIAIFNVIYMIGSEGKFGGWLYILGGIYAISSTFNLHKSYKEYKKSV